MRSFWDCMPGAVLMHGVQDDLAFVVQESETYSGGVESQPAWSDRKTDLATCWFNVGDPLALDVS